MTARIQPGDVLKVNLPTQLPSSHEQQGRRPAVVVGIPEALGEPRFPFLIVVTFTSQIHDYTQRAPALYPVFPAGMGGLTVASVTLTDQVRGVDLSRVRGYLGRLPSSGYTAVHQALGHLLGF